MKVLVVGAHTDVPLWAAFLPNAKIVHLEDFTGCDSGGEYDIAVVSHRCTSSSSSSSLKAADITQRV